MSRRGGKVLKEIWPPLGTTDFSPYLTDIKSINPPVTYDFMPGADAVRFIQQYSEFGLKEKMPLTGFTIIDSQTISALGKSAIGVISALTYTDTVDNPESKKFAANYQAKYKASPDLFADYGFVAARALAEALKMIDGDTSNKDKLAEAMTKVKFNAPRGPFRMDPATHNPIQDIYICQVIEQRRQDHHQDPRHQQRRHRSGKENLLTARPAMSPDVALRPHGPVVAQLLNGLVYGVLLFLMAAGLSLIFGLMNVVSLAHGSFFMLGAYLGLSIFRRPAASGSRWCWRRSLSSPSGS